MVRRTYKGEAVPHEMERHSPTFLWDLTSTTYTLVLFVSASEPTDETQRQPDHGTQPDHGIQPDDGRARKTTLVMHTPLHGAHALPMQTPFWGTRIAHADALLSHMQHALIR